MLVELAEWVHRLSKGLDPPKGRFRIKAREDKPFLGVAQSALKHLIQRLAIHFSVGEVGIEG